MAEKAAQPAKVPEKGTAVPVKAEPARRGSWLARREAEIDRLFEDLFDDLERGFRWPRLLRRWQPTVASAPRLAHVDVFETGDDVIVKAELPGVAKEEIEVTLSDATLTLKAEKKREEEIKEEEYYCCERSFGSVLRTVELPAEVQIDKAVAKMTDGVLEVRVPKTAEARAKSVKVAVR